MIINKGKINNMKRIILFTLAILVVLCTLCSCKSQDNPNFLGKFGDFSYNGIYLTEYAKKQITVDEAKALVGIRNSSDNTHENSMRKGMESMTLASKTVLAILTNYSSVTATTKYYISERTEEQVRVDIYQGTDFFDILDNNSYTPFGQMNVRYIYVDDEILDQMDFENKLFLEDTENLIAPFSCPFTYHTGEDGNLIVQSHSFAELPASVNGGIGSTFRQDSEYIFNEEGLIVFWQSSLGIYTSTPTGTVKQGYIFSVSFDWTEK